MDLFELHQRAFMRDYTPIIKKDDLQHGTYYKGRCRNATIARWDMPTELFYYWRTKFGKTFVDCIRCPEDEHHFDVFVAETPLDNVDTEIPLPKLG